jgi:hypothetical protein
LGCRAGEADAREPGHTQFRQDSSRVGIAHHLNFQMPNTSITEMDFFQLWWAMPALLLRSASTIWHLDFCF